MIKQHLIDQRMLFEVRKVQNLSMQKKKKKKYLDDKKSGVL